MPGTSGETAIDKNMQSLIPCVNKLQAIFSQLKFSPVDLPEVVAIGGQSAGKTSVIENLVGKEFLSLPIWKGATSTISSRFLRRS